MGRAGVDLYPMQLETLLEDVEGFHKYVGGFAANVATGLARLGVRVAIVSAVGDDGHGRFVRSFLEAEGVDCRWLGVHPTLRTALAFCEAWPPDRFPITFYRTPTCPDWEVAPGALDLAAIAAAPLVYVSGTGLAREPSRLATMAVDRGARRRRRHDGARPRLAADAVGRPGRLRRGGARVRPHGRRRARLRRGDHRGCGCERAGAAARASGRA